jgi:hypothetical protein
MAIQPADSTGKPAKKSIFSMLKMVATILGIVVFLLTVITNLVVVYIVFAPDDYPKPFYLNSYGPGGPTEAAVSGQEGQTSGEAANPEGGEQNPATSGEEGTNSETAAAPKDEILPGEGVLLDTGVQILNLGDTGKFIRTNIVLEFAPDDPRYFENEVAVAEPAAAGGEGEAAAAPMAISPRDEFLALYKEELNGQLPLVKDIFVSLFSTKTSQNLYTSEGKAALRQEIMQAVNSRLTHYRVISVYFTEFVMQ